MSEGVTVHGYRYSVYTRMVHMALFEKGVGFDVAEVDPFGDDLPPGYRDLHPFGRVPVLCHGGFCLYETAAITRYVDAAFPGPPLTPTDARGIARLAQVIGIVDSYAYWPLVRQVFAHRVFHPMVGEAGCEREIATGLAASERVLDVVDRIAAEGLVLTGTAVTLADCHLAPVIAYFALAPEGKDALAQRPALSRWWRSVEAVASVVTTDPGIALPANDHS